MPRTGPVRPTDRGPAHPARLVARLGPALAVLAVWSAVARGHDIPNARVDRSIQAVVKPGALSVVYEVSLAELTLTQELRSLIGSLPGADRSEWFAAYGRETGPLNAKGMLVTVDGRPVDLLSDGFDLVVEEHPRFFFRFRAAIPRRGRLTIRDTNFVSSEGTSRLAVRGEGVRLLGDDLPADVDAIPVRPVWQLSTEEERRTREVTVTIDTPDQPSTPASAALHPPRPKPVSTAGAPLSSGLSRLLDRAKGLPLAALAALALALGAAHAFQPGHGKSLVAATAVSDGGQWSRAAALAAATTVTHAGSVGLVALALWWTGSLDFPGVHRALTRSSGFVIAAVGLWRLGRWLGGFPVHGAEGHGGATGRGGVVGLGVAGGLVPCWDAVGLVVLSAAVGRLGLGLVLVAAFSAGMGLVLVGIGWAVAKFRTSLAAAGVGSAWERRLGLASGAVLAGLGVYLLR